jgi:Uma2 family endonuclease
MTATAEDDVMTLEGIIDALGLPIKLEVVEGQNVWSMSPTKRHQRVIDAIRRSIRTAEGSDCGCVHYSDVLIRFGETRGGRRPDIAIWCQEPEEEDTPISDPPQAVVEITSPGSKHKDHDIAATYYLARGVWDVIVVDPEQQRAWLTTLGGQTQALSLPWEGVLRMGCALTIPRI